MIYIFLNALPILAATIAGLAIGFAYARVTGGALPISRGFLMLAFIAEFWLAAILAGALILAPAKADPWIMASGSAIVIWIGFVVPVIIVTQRYRAAPASAVISDCLHWLAVMLAQAIVMKSIGLVAPPGG